MILPWLSKKMLAELMMFAEKVAFLFPTLSKTKLDSVAEYISIISYYNPIITYYIFEYQQSGAPQIAKLVYNSNNYGLWYL